MLRSGVSATRRLHHFRQSLLVSGADVHQLFEIACQGLGSVVANPAPNSNRQALWSMMQRDVGFTAQAALARRATNNPLVRLAKLSRDDPEFFNILVLKYATASSGKTLPDKLSAIDNIEMAHDKALVAGHEWRRSEASSTSATTSTTATKLQVFETMHPNKPTNALNPVLPL